MVFRVTVQMRNYGQLSGKGPEALYSPNYTGNHIAIFECDLKSPPSLSLIETSTEDFIMAHKLNFRNWRLVDVDHYMKGNSFFSTTLNPADWQRDYEERMGAYDDRHEKVVSNKDAKGEQ